MGWDRKHERLMQISGAGSSRMHLRDLLEHTRNSPSSVVGKGAKGRQGHIFKMLTVGGARQVRLPAASGE